MATTVAIQTDRVSVKSSPSAQRKRTKLAPTPLPESRPGRDCDRRGDGTGVEGDPVDRRLQERPLRPVALEARVMDEMRDDEGRRPERLEYRRQSEVPAENDQGSEEAGAVPRCAEGQRRQREDGEGHRQPVEQEEVRVRPSQCLCGDSGSDRPDQRYRENRMHGLQVEPRPIECSRGPQQESENRREENKPIRGEAARDPELSPIAVEGRADDRRGQQPGGLGVPGQICDGDNHRQHQDQAGKVHGG